MRAIVFDAPGGPDSLHVADVPEPKAGPGEVLIDVTATAVNRADTLQRRGLYPPPPGSSQIIGLECSGRIASLDAVLPEKRGGWSVGDPVCALLAGGGYAERVAVPIGQVMPVPAGIDLGLAAALPEVACTVWSNLFLVGNLLPAQTLLVHGGAGGIGTFAIQLATAFGVCVIATAGSPAKLALCRELGADEVIDYRAADMMRSARPFDVVMDCVGATTFASCLPIVAPGGRFLIMAGDLAQLLGALRKGPQGKRALAGVAPERAADLAALADLSARGLYLPVIDSVIALDDIAAAHARVDSGHKRGSVVVTLTAWSASPGRSSWPSRDPASNS